MHDYALYLPAPEDASIWGVEVTAAGFTRIAPGAEYPPRGPHHPADHQFLWAKGRVLDTWQMVLIQAGGGWFESKPTGRRRIEAGTVFIIFPGVWHRYAPDPKTGWVESWFELDGTVPKGLRRQGKLHPRKAVFALGSQPALTQLFAHGHVLAENRPVGYAAQLAALSLQSLALILSLAQTPSGPPRRIDEIVRRAEVLLTERCDQAVEIPSLARELGIGYSYFRRAFRQRTGLSPKQYLGGLRTRRVQTLLRNSSLTVKEIAERLGYHSPYHLSAEFKKRAGQSPQHWRQQRTP